MRIEMFSSKSEGPRRPEVIEAYRDYAPPFKAGRAVRRLVDSVDQRHVHGVRSVVLTNLAALGRDQRRRKGKSRGRTFTIEQVLGRYHPAWKGGEAWIELFVDQIFKNCPGWFTRVPPLREMTLGRTLFHEIGHHIHRTQAPEYREKESVADAWVRRLNGRYAREHYWYLLPVALVLKPPVDLARWYFKRRARITTA
jgi:hypothetical protein